MLLVSKIALRPTFVLMVEFAELEDNVFLDMVEGFQSRGPKLEVCDWTFPFTFEGDIEQLLTEEDKHLLGTVDDTVNTIAYTILSTAVFEAEPGTFTKEALRYVAEEAGKISFPSDEVFERIIQLCLAWQVFEKAEDARLKITDLELHENLDRLLDRYRYRKSKFL